MDGTKVIKRLPLNKFNPCFNASQVELEHVYPLALLTLMKNNIQKSTTLPRYYSNRLSISCHLLIQSEHSLHLKQTFCHF